MFVERIPTWSRSVMRLALSVGLILAAWLLATCGGPARTRSDASAGGDVLLVYRRTGGLAGLNDQLTIHANGKVTLQQKNGRQDAFMLDDSTLSGLMKTLDSASFFQLESRYEPGRTIPDALNYEITYRNAGRRHTVTVTDGAIPQQLAPLLDQLNEIMAEH